MGRNGGGRQGQRVCLLLFFVPLLFLSFSSFLIVSFSVEYSNRRAGRDGPTRAAMAMRDETRGQVGTAGTSSVTVFFFLLSSFLLLAFTISFVANYSNRRGRTEWDLTGRDDAGGDTDAGRDRG